MAAIQPTELSHKIVNEHEEYSIDKFTVYISKILHDHADPEHDVFTTIYSVFGNYVISHKEDIAKRLSVPLQELVKKAQDNGYDLLSQLTPSVILELFDIPPNVNNPTSWITQNFLLIIQRIDDKINDIKNHIADQTQDISNSLSRIMTRVLRKYNLDFNHLSAGSEITKRVPEIRTKILSDFQKYQGDFFNPNVLAFFNKDGFNVEKEIEDELKKPEFKTWIIKEVKSKWKIDVLTMQIIPTASTRNLASMIFKQVINEEAISTEDIENNFLIGYRNLVDPYMSNNKFTLKKISIENYNYDDDKKTATFTIKTILNLDEEEIELSTPGVTLHQYVYPLANFFKLLRESNPKISLSGPIILDKNKKLPIGQVTKQQLLDADLSDPSGLSATELINRFDSIISAVPSIKYQLIVFEEFGHQKIDIKLIDTSIKPNDFDSSQKQLLEKTSTSVKLNDYFLEMRESVTRKILLPLQTSIYSDLFNSGDSIKSRYEIFPTLNISYNSPLDSIAKIAVEETEDQDKRHMINYEDLLRPDGSLIDVDDRFMSRVTDGWHFITELAARKGITYTFSRDSSKYFIDTVGDKTWITISITDGTNTIEKRLKIRTFNINNVFDTMNRKIDSYENTWEDVTPSHSLSTLSNGGFIHGRDVKVISPLHYIDNGFERIISGYTKLDFTNLGTTPDVFQGDNEETREFPIIKLPSSPTKNYIYSFKGWTYIGDSITSWNILIRNKGGKWDYKIKSFNNGAEYTTEKYIQLTEYTTLGNSHGNIPNDGWHRLPNGSRNLSSSSVAWGMNTDKEFSISHPQSGPFIEQYFYIKNNQLILGTIGKRLNLLTPEHQDSTLNPLVMSSIEDQSQLFTYDPITLNQWGRNGEGRFIEGAVPGISDLGELFGQGFINDFSHDALSSAKLTYQINPITTETHSSKITYEILKSWNLHLLPSNAESLYTKKMNQPTNGSSIVNADLFDEFKDQIDDIINKIHAMASLLKIDQSKYIVANIDLISGSKIVHHKLKLVHYLSLEQRLVEFGIINIIFDKLKEVAMDKIPPGVKLPKETIDKLLNKFEEIKKDAIDNAKRILKVDENGILKGHENDLIPDWRINDINIDTKELTDLLNGWSKTDFFGLSIKDLQKASLAFRYAMTSMGAILGGTALLAFMTPIKTALANNKYKRQNGRSRKSAKKIMAISSIAGIITSASSIAILLYVFVAQGGL